MQFTSGGAATNQYNTKLVIVSNGYVYIGHSAPNNVITLASGQATPPLIPDVPVSIAVISNFAYIVDGSKNIVEVDLNAEAVSTYAAKSSTAPAPTLCTIAANWQGRLVLCGDTAHPQDVYMSRSGDPTDWDYSQTDAAAAFTTNLAKTGLVGQPITAFIPFNDDVSMVGCTHSLWSFRGNPSAGGILATISENLGIVGKDAWVTDPANTLYFVGTSGIYSVRPMYVEYKPPELMTGQNYAQYFQKLSFGGAFISLVWDADLHYMYLFAAPTDASVGTHLVWDERNGGLWAQNFPSNHGPVATAQWFGNASAADRTILLGGWDGYIRRMNVAATNDDGGAISASLTMGPIHPSPGASILAATTIDFGETLPSGSSTWGVSTTTNSGPDAYEVTEGSTRHGATVFCSLERRQKTFRQRLRGGFFSMTLANSTMDTYFSFESAQLEFIDAGRDRERR